MEAMHTVNPVSHADQSAFTTAQTESSALAAATQTSNNVQPGGELGKDEFLNLLVTQLSNQDPLNPMDSTESIAQLAQFSALEQMQNVAEQVQKQRHAAGILDAMLLHGQNVEVDMHNGSTASGIIENAIWMNDELNLTINGQTIPFSDVMAVRLHVPEHSDLVNMNPDTNMHQALGGTD